MIYQQCGPVCPQTCDNYDNAECSSGCVDGCFCPSETVLSYGYCINVSYCQGRYYALQLFVEMQYFSFYILYNIYITFVVLNVTDISFTTPNTQLVGQPLMLECSVTTVRGITSRVDIVWSSDGVELMKLEGAIVNSTLNDSVIYISSYSIQILSTNDSDRVYQCTMVINTDPPVLAHGSVTLDITGKVVCI